MRRNLRSSAESGPPLGALALALALAACSGSEPPPEVLVWDIAARLPAAQAASEAAELAPRLEADGGAVVLPAGQRLDVYLRLPAASRLRLDKLALRGSPAPALAVTLQRAGGEPQLVARLERPSEAVSLPLPEGGQSIARLTLAVETAVEPGTGHAVLFAPRVTAAAAAPEPPPVPRAATTAETPRPDLIVYLVDTLRADHLGAYGYSPSVSPALDAFAAGATVYTRAVAESSWTRASVASLFTGLTPHRHGVNGRDDALPPEALTLAELLSASGYATWAFISNGNVASEFGFDQGFDRFVRLQPPANGSEDVTRAVLSALGSGELERPFFLYVHTIDPHHPYEPPEPYLSRLVPDDPAAALELGRLEVLQQVRRGDVGFSAEERERVIALYDAEVAANDQRFGELIEELRRLGLYDGAAVAFLSDHGEEFWDHDSWGHGHTLYREVLDIPLVLKRPGQRAGEVSDRLVSIADLTATLLHFAGLEAPRHMDGAGLPASGPAPDPAAERTIYSKLELDNQRAASITAVEAKLIDHRSGRRRGSLEIFDRRSDPAERRAEAAPDPIVAGYLLGLLRLSEHPAAGAIEPATATMDEALIQELKALGYLQ